MYILYVKKFKNVTKILVKTKKLIQELRGIERNKNKNI